MHRNIEVAFLIFSLLFINYKPSLSLAQEKEQQEIEHQLPIDESASVPQAAPETPASESEEKMNSSVNYIIAEGDAMEVFIWQNPDLSKSITVGPDGKISYPLAGRFRVVGLTIEQLEDLIRERLSKFVKYPQVSVMMTGYSGNKIIMLGEVNGPAVYTYTGRLNLIEAVAIAGDFTAQANKDSVIVVRGNLTKHPKAFRVNVGGALKKGTSGTDFLLEPNDVIYVPRSFIHNLNKFVKNITTFIDEGRKVMDLRKDIISKAILGSTREAAE